MTQYVVFDIDGTLADCKHREHHVTEKTPKDWDTFKSLIPLDEVIEEIATLLKIMHTAGYRVVLLTGRDESCRKDTVEWMAKHNLPFDRLWMRANDDYRPDYECKRELMEDIIDTLWYKPLIVFEDRISVINVWKDMGIFVADINQKKRSET